MPRSSVITPEKFTTFGELLKYLRHRAGLTQLELSIAVGYSESQISRMEKNERAPDKAALAARFVPALHLETDQVWVTRLLELAASRTEHEPEQREHPSQKSLHNLPIQLTSFVGREKEIAEILALLMPRRAATDGVKLLTLTGPGGTGKTRLALQVASDLLDRFPDGAWLVDLAPLVNPLLVPQTVATVLGVKEEPTRPLLSTLTDYVRRRQLLLILDNCEHVIAASAQFAEALLHVCPELRILATSREALGIAGEKPFYVPPLSTPNPGDSSAVETLTRYEAVRLLAERAGSVLSDFVVTSENASAVAQVCQRLDGLPLAIELAAARLRMFSVEQIAARLDDRFRLLTGGSRTALPRQQTLQATIDWSHELLTAAEQVLLRRLAVFAGGWTLEAAEAVGVGDVVVAGNVVELLGHLIDKSLVVVEEQTGAARYRMLETIRQYALAKLEASDEEDAIRLEHARFFQGLAKEAEAGLLTADRTMWLERLDAEDDNFRTILAWCRAKPEFAELGLVLAGTLRWYWYNRRLLTEGREWIQGALDSTKTLGRTKSRAQGIFTAGMLAFYQSDFVISDQLLQDSILVWTAIGDKRGLAYALLYFGWSALFQGDYVTARQRLDESVALFRQVKDHWALAFALHPLGLIANAAGDLAAARSFFQESFTLFQQSGDQWGISFPLTGLARIAFHEGDYAAARAWIEQSLTLRREVGDEYLMGHSLQVLGLVARAQQDYALAEASFGEGLLLFQEIGNTQGFALCLAGVAGVAGATGQPERAAQLFGAAQGIVESARATLFLADTADYERNLSAVRAQLDEQEFATAWAEGRAMTTEQAIAKALRSDA